MPSFPYKPDPSNPSIPYCPILNFQILDPVDPTNVVTSRDGLIDTGAGISTVTIDIIDALNITPYKDVDLEFWSVTPGKKPQKLIITTYLYVIDIRVPGATPEVVKESFALFYEVIIGRNILSCWEIILEKNYQHPSACFIIR